MNIFKIEKNGTTVIVLQEQTEKQPEVLFVKNAWTECGINVYGNACLLRENEIISLKEFDKKKIIITKYEYGDSFYVDDEIEVDTENVAEMQKEDITVKMVLTLQEQAYINEKV